MGNKTLRELAQILYGKSPNEIRAEESPFPIWGTGGRIGSAQRPLFSGPIIILPRKGTLTNPSYCETDCWVIDTAYAAIAHQNVDTKWLFYNLSLANLESLNEATGVPSINRDMLYRLNFYALDFEEQQKIAEILTTVDNLIEQTEAAIAKYQAIKQGMMHDLFTRGVDANGHLRSPREEAPELYKESELGWIPREWSTQYLGDMSKFYSGYAFKEQELSEEGMKIVRISNLHKSEFTYWHYNQNPNDNWIVKYGDLLFSWAGVASSIDIYIYKGETALINQHIYNIKFKTENIKLFCFNYIQFTLPQLRESIEGGAGQLHLSKDKIYKITIPLPDPIEMDTILHAFNTINSKLTQNETTLNKFYKLKSGLMQDLLSGRVRVPTAATAPQESPHAS